VINQPKHVSLFFSTFDTLCSLFLAGHKLEGRLKTKMTDSALHIWTPYQATGEVSGQTSHLVYFIPGSREYSYVPMQSGQAYHIEHTPVTDAEPDGTYIVVGLEHGRQAGGWLNIGDKIAHIPVNRQWVWNNVQPAQF